MFTAWIIAREAGFQFPVWIVLAIEIPTDDAECSLKSRDKPQQKASSYG